MTGFVSSRIGGRRTLLAGLALVVVFAALAGTSRSVGQLVGFRAGWGLGMVRRKALGHEAQEPAGHPAPTAVRS